MQLLFDPNVDALISLALAEDLPKGDPTTETCIPEQNRSKAAFVARETFIVAGLFIAREIFSRLDNQIKFSIEIEEGAEVTPKQTLAVIEGNSQTILKGERTALNFLQRLCGVATQANRYKKAVEHTSCQVVDTRKTTPGWRRLEKYAARIGGIRNHRADLSSGIMIKDNHIVAANGIKNAITRARQQVSHLLKIEVEVENHTELLEAIRYEADVILLDNMSPEEIKESIRLAEEHKTGSKRVLLEASGGITLDRIAAYAETDVDFISVGAITHGARAVDIGLDFL